MKNYKVLTTITSPMEKTFANEVFFHNEKDALEYMSDNYKEWKEEMKEQDEFIEFVSPEDEDIARSKSLYAACGCGYDTFAISLSKIGEDKQ